MTGVQTCALPILGRVYFRSYSGGPLAFGFDYWFPSQAQFDFGVFRQDCTVTAPSEAAVSVNGVTLNAENCSVSWALPEELEPYASELPELPSRARYRFSAFSAPQVGSASDEFWISEDEAAPNVFTVTQMCSTELSEQLHGLAENFVRAYIAFTSKAVGGTGTVNAYTVPNSNLYQRVIASVEGLSWVSGVTSTMSDLTVDSLQYYGCAATLEAHYTLDTRGTKTDNNMRLILAPTANGWKVAEIDLF